MWETLGSIVDSVVDGGKWLLETVGNTFGLNQFGFDMFSDTQGFDIWDWAGSAFDSNEFTDENVIEMSGGADKWWQPEGEFENLGMSIGKPDVESVTEATQKAVANSNASSWWSELAPETKKFIFSAAASGALGALNWSTKNKELEQLAEENEKNRQNKLDQIEKSYEAKERMEKNLRIQPTNIPNLPPIINDPDALARRYERV